MAHGMKTGVIVGVLAVIVGYLEPIVIGGSIESLLFVVETPTLLLRSLLWNVTIFAMIGALYEQRRGGRQAGSAEDATGPRGFDSEMREFDE